MRKPPLLVSVLALGLGLAVFGVASSRSASAADEGRRTLEGDYDWNGGSRGPLTATFAPDGSEKWRVSFRFRHAGGSYTWEGTAQGILGSGELRGRVRDAGSRRVFTFRGDFDAKGRFEGRHSEVHGGGESPTGTLRLDG